MARTNKNTISADIRAEARTKIMNINIKLRTALVAQHNNNIYICGPYDQ